MSDRVKIFVKPNGSVRVTGVADFVDADGNVIETKENFSLCRCATPKKNHSAMALTAKLDSKPNNSLWADTAECFESKSQFADSYDVAIIGGGFSGLWSAFHLINLNPNLKIAVFEAKVFGFGASGRNGGWASSDYPVSRSRLIKRHGLYRTNSLFNALISSIDEIGSFAQRFAPQSHFTKSGTVTFARNSAQEKRLSKSADELHIWKSAEELSHLIRVSDAEAVYSTLSVQR